MNEDDTTDRNYCHEDGPMRIFIDVRSHRPDTGGKNALDRPEVKANGDIQDMLCDVGRFVRVSHAELFKREETAYSAWRKIGYASCLSSLGVLGGL